ncbi:MAG: ABC transporter ATP-binding protein, partial [Bacilli bacterium]
MSCNTVLSVNNVSKVYKVYEHPKEKLLELIDKKKRSQDYYALKPLSFDIEKGSSVGILGRNGSGKSTLLQMIAGTVTPSSGTIDIKGRVVPLLELGSGFNQDYTGRENVYLNGAMYGISKKEMENKFADIEEFADIGEYIDQPVKTYSSGMFARLAFAVAINMEPDILIVDEILAVGDMAFQAKCVSKMR